MSWNCGLCQVENGELADSCTGCGAVHIATSCCDGFKPKQRTHEIRGKLVCSTCMTLADYHERIDRITNVFESRAWLDKHCDEIQERPQAFIKQIVDRYYTHHFALQDAKHGRT